MAYDDKTERLLEAAKYARERLLNTQDDTDLPAVKKLSQAISAFEPEQKKPTVAERITEYLAVGGFFNPEYMDHWKVRDLLIDARKELTHSNLGQSWWIDTVKGQIFSMWHSGCIHVREVI